MEEARALRQAVAASLVEVKAMADQAGGALREALAFQVEMLADDELAGSAHHAIARGVLATTAWTAAMAAEIDSYRTSGDEYFSSRAADLQTICNRVLAHLPPAPITPEAPKTSVPPGAVVVATDLTLARFLSINWAHGGAIVLTKGNPLGDVASLARARGVPMVVGLGATIDPLAGKEALVDATAGEVVLNPAPNARIQCLRRSKNRVKQAKDLAIWRNRDGQTADGTRIALHLSLADSAELASLDPGRYDGIGLLRTETLFYDPSTGALPDETSQYQVYRQVVEWADDRPVTIRTLDAGADRPIPGLSMAAESNPCLGLRGIRLSLHHPDLLRTQFRALARAAVYGPIRIALPMVTIPAEFHAARRLLDAVMSGLAHESITARRPALGMVVEVPAAALAIDQFAAEFFCVDIGALTQYVTAASRDNGAVADLADPLNPAVLRLISEMTKQAREVTLLGDMMGTPSTAEPDILAQFVYHGARGFSVSPSALAQVKQAIAAIDLQRKPDH